METKASRFRYLNQYTGTPSVTNEFDDKGNLNFILDGKVLETIKFVEGNVYKYNNKDICIVSLFTNVYK